MANLCCLRVQHGRALELLELVSVVIFTLDYLLRFLTAHHDPEFAGKSMPNLRYIFSFYSIIDLLTTAPYFLALAFPGSVIDQYDEALRMLRLLRLLKMDKWASIIPKHKTPHSKNQSSPHYAAACHLLQASIPGAWL